MELGGIGEVDERAVREEIGGGIDQNILCTCIKFLNNKKLSGLSYMNEKLK